MRKESALFQILSTNRLYLRKLVKEDLPFLTRLHQDHDVMKYIGPPSTRDQVQQRMTQILQSYSLNPGLGVWMACLAESDACIGWACLKDLDGSEHIEVGYRLAKSYWGNGYATELCKALLRYGFDELKISTICAVARPDNVASRRVLEKCGLKDQGMAIYYNTEVIF